MESEFVGRTSRCTRGRDCRGSRASTRSEAAAVPDDGAAAGLSSRRATEQWRPPGASGCAQQPGRRRSAAASLPHRRESPHCGRSGDQERGGGWDPRWAGAEHSTSRLRGCQRLEEVRVIASVLVWATARREGRRGRGGPRSELVSRADGEAASVGLPGGPTHAHLGRDDLPVALRSGLRQGRTKRRSRSRQAAPRRMHDMVNISERPAEVADRAVPGSAAATKIPTASCGSTSRRARTSAASTKNITMRRSGTEQPTAADAHLARQRADRGTPSESTELLQ